MTDNRPLITKYRPDDFDEFFGHEAVIGALVRTITAEDHAPPHAYLFTGPAGTGKTSMARVVGATMECEIIEIDAASNNGIDNMRELTELGNHMALSGAGQRMFIIDECHGLSKPAWNAILKLLEEPPDHLYIALCTTEAHKIIETIMSRCYHVALKALSPNEISDYLDVICEMQGWEVLPDVMAAIIQNCKGSPRNALSILQVVHDAPSMEEVKRIIVLLDGSDALIELAQGLIRGQNKWEFVGPILAQIGDDEFQQAPISMGRYIASAMAKAKTQAEAQRAWQLLEALVYPSSGWDPKINFYAAIGRMVFA